MNGTLVLEINKKDILGKGLIVHEVLMTLCLNLLVMLEQE
jgi:hypothetical protein